MIISASRRTDIPAFYAEWMVRRLREGYCTVANPFNRNQVVRISLKPEAWTPSCSGPATLAHGFRTSTNWTPVGRDLLTQRHDRLSWRRRPDKMRQVTNLAVPGRLIRPSPIRGGSDELSPPSCTVSCLVWPCLAMAAVAGDGLVSPGGGTGLHDFNKWAAIIHRQYKGKMPGGYAFEVCTRARSSRREPKAGPALEREGPSEREMDA